MKHRPDSILKDGDGGMIVSWIDGDQVESVHFWDDGVIDYQVWNGTQLKARQVFDGGWKEWASYKNTDSQSQFPSLPS